MKLSSPCGNKLHVNELHAAKTRNQSPGKACYNVQPSVQHDPLTGRLSIASLVQQWSAGLQRDAWISGRLLSHLLNPSSASRTQFGLTTIITNCEMRETSVNWLKVEVLHRSVSTGFKADQFRLITLFLIDSDSKSLRYSMFDRRKLKAWCRT